MSRRLTLVRHAKSDWGDFSLSDFDRTLNRRGLRDAPAMGKRLAERGDAPDLILCSPAVRARTTAQILAEALSYPQEAVRLEPSIYEAPVSALLEAVRSADGGCQHVMMVGHNPGCEQFAGFLMGEPFPRFVTCGVADLDVAVEAWTELGPGVATLRSYWYPKMFPAEGN